MVAGMLKNKTDRQSWCYSGLCRCPNRVVVCLHSADSCALRSVVWTYDRTLGTQLGDLAHWYAAAVGISMSEGTHQFGNISLGSRSGTVCLLAIARQDSPFDRLTFNLIRNTAESRSVENNYSRLLLEEDWRRSRQNCRATHQRSALGSHSLNSFSLEPISCMPSWVFQCGADIEKFIWTKVARGCQLGVKGNSGATTNFTGFRDQV